MDLELYQIDTFTRNIFSGNPACVVPLEEWLPDEILFKITQENAVAETAFFIEKANEIHLRWFTPEVEMDLCGHATLAAAYCLFQHLDFSRDEVIFQSKSGELKVLKDKDAYIMELPSRMPVKSELPDSIFKALNRKPMEVYKSRDYVLIYETQEEIENIEINRNYFDQINLGTGGVIVTAKGEESDFVSRFFTPQASILEDPVTGSAHCSLVPFWAERLAKDKLKAIQVSNRKGYLDCINKKDKVILKGNAKTYLKGTIYL